ncbi:MAG: hypothetical protein KIS94_12430 [Chitinophagales bacterium]|nr:hypothetical protein [Chitinophagales bacterium]
MNFALSIFALLIVGFSAIAVQAGINDMQDGEPRTDNSSNKDTDNS